MSTAPVTINVAPRFAPTDAAPRPQRTARAALLIRGLAFAALGLYGVVRWATLISPAPTGRLLGLLGLAVALVAVVVPLRRIGPPPAIAAAVLLCLLALPVAGLRWDDFLHLRIAVGAREIGDGLSGLPGSFVPYAGSSHAIRTVIALGAAVLLLDGAVVLAFAPRALHDLRRAGAALPLIALAVVPSTLLRPQLPYVQGLILFVLIAAFVWGERAHWDRRGAVLALLGVAGLAGALIAPRIDSHHAWLDYRAWTGNLARPHLDSFSWNQSYGPLHWPRTQHVVFTVAARHPDYWKAQDLDVFNGTAWVAGPVVTGPLPAPAASALTRWTQRIDVDITGMRSRQVIASGYAGPPSPLPGGVIAGDGAGTWQAQVPLTRGSQYAIDTYAPHPTPIALRRAHHGYPNRALTAYRSLALPLAGLSASGDTEVEFAPFPARTPIVPGTTGPAQATQAIDASAYGPVYALARRLADGTRTPYAYAVAIERFLTRGYAYNENPPRRLYPLISFLFRDRIGYCQQFSGTMALLLRMGGVPARVSEGFTSGSVGAHGRFVVTDIDAHAWVEVWFPHYGWVRFDPTPKIAPARGGNSPVPFVKNLPGDSAAAAPSLSHSLQSTPASATHVHHRRAAGTAWWPLAVAGVVVVVLVLGLAGLILAPEPTPERRLAELERALARTGRPLGPDVTLAALERRYRDAPEAAAYIRALRLGRYASHAAPPDRAGRRALRAQLREGLGPMGRLRVLWALPPRPRRPGAGPARRPEPRGPAAAAN